MNINCQAYLLLCTVMVLGACSPAEQPAKEQSQSVFNLQLGEAVQPGVKLQFPQDHGAHPEQGIEWWYVTANLSSNTGEQFGVQWTLFRTSLAQPELNTKWWDDNLYFAHFAIQSDSKHKAAEKYGRAGQVTIQSQPFVASIDDWSMHSLGESFLPLQLRANTGSEQIALTLKDSPIVLHGDNGYSEKTAQGHASYYYSYPFLQVTGRVHFDGQAHQVQGQAWLDREWSAAFIDPEQSGWDWFSLRHQDPAQGALMVFCIRDEQQHYQDCRGTEISQNGSSKHIPAKEINLQVTATTDISGHRYPTSWRLKLDHWAAIDIHSRNPNSRNNLTIPYWEGRVSASGGFTGEGYAELVGYER